MMHKRILDPQRQRRVPRQFSWVDQRLVRDKHFSRYSCEALALYLLLISVADAKGLSYYSDQALMRYLPLDDKALQRARRQLQQGDLIAFENPLYQVLSLDSPTPATTVSHQSTRQPEAMIELLRRALAGNDKP